MDRCALNVAFFKRPSELRLQRKVLFQLKSEQLPDKANSCLRLGFKRKPEHFIHFERQHENQKENLHSESRRSEFRWSVNRPEGQLPEKTRTAIELQNTH